MRKKDRNKLPIVGFTYNIQKVYLQLSGKAIKRLLPLPTTYLGKAGFSS